MKLKLVRNRNVSSGAINTYCHLKSRVSETTEHYQVQKKWSTGENESVLLATGFRESCRKQTSVRSTFARGGL